jgi:hypothetical protein
MRRPCAPNRKGTVLVPIAVEGWSRRRVTEQAAAGLAKNPEAPAVKREAEEDWVKPQRRLPPTRHRRKQFVFARLERPQIKL